MSTVTTFDVYLDRINRGERLSPDDSLVATGETRGTARIWDVGRRVESTLKQNGVPMISKRGRSEKGVA